MTQEQFNVTLFIITVVTILCSVIAVVILESVKSKKAGRIKQWLKYAVRLAETKYGSGNGAYKLEYVYTLFTTKYPIVSKVIPDFIFKAMVDEALIWLNRFVEDDYNTSEDKEISDDEDDCNDCSPEEDE